MRNGILVKAVPVLLILSGALLSGCASWFPTEEGYRQFLAAWVGHTSMQLIAQWGEPTAEHTTSSGTKIYLYRSRRSYAVSGGTKSEAVMIGGKYVYVDIPQPDEIETTWCDTTFRLSQKDIIEGYGFVGPDCTAYEK